MTDRSQYIEEIRVRALRLMEDRKMQLADVVRDCHRVSTIGPRNVQGFIRGEFNYQTIGNAYVLSCAYPELNEGLTCPHCHRTMF